MWKRPEPRRKDRVGSWRERHRTEEMKVGKVTAREVIMAEGAVGAKTQERDGCGMVDMT